MRRIKREAIACVQAGEPHGWEPIAHTTNTVRE